MSDVTKAKYLPYLLLALLLAHLAVSFGYNVVHFFIPDEIVYMLMNQGLSMGGLAVVNGYEEFAAKPLIFTMTSEYQGQTYAQYPAIYTFLSLPFYLLADKGGLVMLNQLAFFAILFAVYRLQKALFDSSLSAGFAVLILAAGSHIWLYSQVVMPHLTQVAFIMLAAWLFAESFWQGKAPWRYLLAGLLLGIALGVRYDTLFVLPAFALPLLFASSIRWKGLLALAPGLIVGLLALCITNEIKFGQFVPFTYASDSGFIRMNPVYYYLAVLGLAVLAITWGGARLAARGKLPAIKWLVLLGALAVSAVFFLFFDWIIKLLYGLNLTLVDYSSLPIADVPKQSVTRTEYGGFMYMGEYKRALLQSCPFIAIIGVLALRKLSIARAEWQKYVWLLVATLPFFAFYGLLAWDGGFAYHMRYYTPTLPFFALLCGQVLCRLLEAFKLLNLPSYWLWPGGLGLLSALVVAFWADTSELAIREWALLYLPLWLWALVPLAVAFAFYDRAARWLKQSAVLAVFFTIFWGGVTSIGIVYPHLNDYKQKLLDLSLYYEAVIEDDALVLSTARYFTHFFGQPERRFRMATIYEAGDPVTPEDIRDMMRHYIDQGTAVYITHDIKAFPILKKQWPEWGMQLQLAKPADKAIEAPAISRVLSAEAP